MSSTARGAEEEVFETPDFAEDDLEQASAGQDSGLPKAANNVPDAEVVSSVVPPHAAFEVFMGRTYAGAREDMSDVVGATSASFSAEGGAVYEGDGYHLRTGGDGGPGEGGGIAGAAVVDSTAAVSGPRRRTGESPVQRLVRLREETAMLAEDLEEMYKARRKGETEGLPEGEGGGRDGGDATSGRAGGYQLWSAMAKETEALKRQLAQLSGDPRFKHILSSSPAAGQDQEALQQRLSEGVVKALESLRERADGSAKETTSGAPALTEAAAAAASPGGAGSVTYELFLAEAADARRRFGASPSAGAEGGISGAEARIAALEKALGGMGEAGANPGFVGKGGEAAPLTELVSALEKRVSMLEPGRLDAVRQKAQLAKAELDSLAKSRSSSGTGSSSSSASRAKKVEEAFAILETWQEVAVGLPALVDRLRALETLHLASASFAQRLEQVETGQTELEGVLKSTKESLDATLQSSIENVSIVTENVQALDRRLAGVGIAS
eukprot:g19665.t1